VPSTTLPCGVYFAKLWTARSASERRDAGAGGGRGRHLQGVDADDHLLPGQRRSGVLRGLVRDHARRLDVAVQVPFDARAAPRHQPLLERVQQSLAADQPQRLDVAPARRTQTHTHTRVSGGASRGGEGGDDSLRERRVHLAVQGHSRLLRLAQPDHRFGHVHEHQLAATHSARAAIPAPAPVRGRGKGSACVLSPVHRALFGAHPLEFEAQRGRQEQRRPPAAGGHDKGLCLHVVSRRGGGGRGTGAGSSALGSRPRSAGSSPSSCAAMRWLCCGRIFGIASCAERPPLQRALSTRRGRRTGRTAEAAAEAEAAAAIRRNMVRCSRAGEGGRRLCDGTTPITRDEKLRVSYTVSVVDEARGRRRHCLCTGVLHRYLPSACVDRVPPTPHAQREQGSTRGSTRGSTSHSTNSSAPKAIAPTPTEAGTRAVSSSPPITSTSSLAQGHTPRCDDGTVPSFAG